jgi:hypothetical protein
MERGVLPVEQKIIAIKTIKGNLEPFLSFLYKYFRNRLHTNNIL